MQRSESTDSELFCGCVYQSAVGAASTELGKELKKQSSFPMVLALIFWVFPSPSVYWECICFYPPSYEAYSTSLSNISILSIWPTGQFVILSISPRQARAGQARAVSLWLQIGRI